MQAGLGFDEGALLRLSGWGAFERAAAYVAQVTGRTVGGATAHATVSGTVPYLVDLSWGSGVLRGHCTCPAAAGGAFCKHQVALGLSLLRESERRPSPAADRSPRPGPGSAVEADPAVWLDRVREALQAGSFLEYRRAIEFGRSAHAMLDEVEDALDAGAADAVRPALERAVTRLRTVGGRADDSAGEIGGACQRAAELFARSCREGDPDPVRLARWLLRFRLSSPGWPVTPLAGFAPAFDERAWRAYRQGVAAAAARLRTDDGRRGTDSTEVQAMLLELLDRDGDVDGAVALLSGGDRPRFGAIIDRLLGADRGGEALAWLDRAVRDGRVWHRDDGVNLSFRTAAGLYAAAGRHVDAVAVWRRGFQESPAPGTLQALLLAAAPLHAEQAEREWAIAWATERAASRYGDGAELVDIALAEGDLDAAVAAAERFGAGRAWERLAIECATARPGVAAELYQSAIDEELRPADVGGYRLAVDHLTRLRAIYRQLGREDLFAHYARGIRERNARRPRFLEEFDRRVRIR